MVDNIVQAYLPVFVRLQKGLAHYRQGSFASEWHHRRSLYQMLSCFESQSDKICLKR